MLDRRMRVRLIKNSIFKYAVIVAGVLVIIPFFIVLYHVVREGISSLSLEFLFHLPKPVGEAGGGIVNAIVGTLMIIAISTVLSVPIGVAGGVFLAEMRKSPLSRLTRTAVSVLQGTPSIVIGIVMYSWLVVPLRGFSAFSGGVALGVMMLPVVINATEETVRLVPSTLKEASLALGVPYYKTVMRIVVPAAFSGIISGVMLAVARVAGETAPLLFTAFGNPYMNFNIFKPTAAVPLVIYDYAKSPYQDWIHKAWGASFVLVVIVLLFNLVVRLRDTKRR